LKYQAAARQTTITDELLTAKLRYKAPDGDSSRLLEVPVRAGAEIAFDKASQDFQFAAAAAAFGMKLRSSSLKREYLVGGQSRKSLDAVRAKISELIVPSFSRSLRRRGQLDESGSSKAINE
jgi:hypothetical protein